MGKNKTKIGIGFGCLGGGIFAGRTKDSKLGNGIKEFVGEKEDVTDEAIYAVYQWFIDQKEKHPNDKEYSIHYEKKNGTESEWELVLRKRKNKRRNK